MTKKNGANFYWADLHIHTPSWCHFKLPSGVNKEDESWKKAYAKKYIEKAQEKKITILGITEHNDVSWIDYIRDAALVTEIIVFPGFEITTQSGADGIHILCLFDPDTTENTLDGLLSSLGLLPGQRFHGDGSPKVIKKDMQEIVKAVKEQKGICIAAHVSSNNGLLVKAEGQIRVDLFTNSDLLAVEIPSGRKVLSNFEKRAISNELNHYRRKFPIACINSSDAKSIDEIGSSKTLIKISSFTVEGLREAFLDWRSRIRLKDELPEESPQFSKILAVKWEGGFLDGVGIHFNDNLNCVIGGKGTGKSTITETIRFCFDEKPKAGKIKEQSNEIIKEVFRSGSKVSVFVEAHDPFPRRYVIERTYPGLPVIREEDGTLRGDLKPKDILQIEVYGQKELYEISKERQFQFELLDRFVGNRLNELKEKQEDILQKLEENKSELLRLKCAIESAEVKIAELPSIQEKINAYKEAGIGDKLNEKKQYSKEELLLKQGLDKLKKFADQLEYFGKGIDLDISFISKADIDELPNKEILEEAGKIIEALSQKVDTSIKTMQNLPKDAVEKYDGKKGVRTKWQELNKEQNERYATILRDLHKKFKAVDPNELIQLEKEVVRLSAIKQDKERSGSKYKALGEKRNNLLIELQESRLSSYRIREEVMNGLNKKLEIILRVRLVYQGEKGEFVERLKRLRSGAREEHLRRVTAEAGFSVIEFTASIRDGASSLAKKYEISPASAQSLCSSISGAELYDLEIFEVPTKATIELNLGSKEVTNYKDIEHLSIGQKCTALLSLILLKSPYPLVVDQPEDDLDNKFIVNDIVNRLRQEKEYRQFIITTHNANIPVLGDAELIIPLEATANQAKVEEELCGSIDDELVKNVVRNILEGGREAFETRKEKYGI